MAIYPLLQVTTNYVFFQCNHPTRCFRHYLYYFFFSFFLFFFPFGFLSIKSCPDGFIWQSTSNKRRNWNRKGHWNCSCCTSKKTRQGFPSHPSHPFSGGLIWFFFFFAESVAPQKKPQAKAKVVFIFLLYFLPHS